MLPEDKYFETLTENELWHRYCGFLDLSVEAWMDIQNQLLMEEIDLIADSTLGKKVMGKRKPKSPGEFRKIVPLTSYDDYEPYLSKKDENSLAVKPKMWCHSSGKGGRFKWCPLTPRFLERIAKNAIGSFILASTSEKGRVNIKPGARCFFLLAPPPYVSGSWQLNLAQHFSFRAIPNPQKCQGMEFQDRMRMGFQEALKEGVDVIGALASVVVKMGEQLKELSQQEKRTVLPKGLWPSKIIITSGMDTAIYRDDIIDYWGSRPYEFYICAEALYIAMQGWNKKAMTFPPDMVFLEFVPYEELLKEEEDKDYQASTVLLDELEIGKLYEVVITHFYGGPLLRYRMNDIIKITALRDGETGVDLPQMVFQRRVGDVINLAGLAQLDEKTLWQAIANTRIKYTEWTACKEYDRNRTFLHLYIELKERKDANQLATMINEQLKLVDTDYKDIDEYLGERPVRVTLLSPGAFERYAEAKKKGGADLAHLKPAHINPPEAVIQHLIKLSEASK